MTYRPDSERLSVFTSSLFLLCAQLIMLKPNLTHIFKDFCTCEGSYTWSNHSTRFYLVCMSSR